MKEEMVQLVDIDFAKMGTAMEKHVRDKAVKAESTIIYMENGSLIEEDPKTLLKTVVEHSPKLTN